MGPVGFDAKGAHPSAVALGVGGRRKDTGTTGATPQVHERPILPCQPLRTVRYTRSCGIQWCTGAKYLK